MKTYRLPAPALPRLPPKRGLQIPLLWVPVWSIDYWGGLPSRHSGKKWASDRERVHSSCVMRWGDQWFSDLEATCCDWESKDFKVRLGWEYWLLHLLAQPPWKGQLPSSDPFFYKKGQLYQPQRVRMFRRLQEDPYRTAVLKTASGN